MNNALTEKELEVLIRFSEGEQVKDIATNMRISVYTIATYKGQIMDKLGVQTFVHAVSVAYDIGIFAKDKDVIKTRIIACELLSTLKGILTLRKVNVDKNKRIHFKIEGFDYDPILETIDKAKFLNLKA